MELDPRNTYAVLGTGVSQIYALVVSYSLSVIGAVVLLIVGYVGAGIAERSLSAALIRIPGFDPTLRRFFAMLARYAILTLVAVMVLGQFGVQTASIVTAVGAIGLTIGLALQGTLQNIAAGIMLLVLRPFRIGEDVEVGAVTGTVEEIGLFATQLRTAEGVYLLAPNSSLWNQPVRNFTRNGMRRNDITIGIGAGQDVDAARKTLLDIAASESRLDKQRPVVVFVSGLDGDATKLTLRYWTSTADFFAAKVELTARILGELSRSDQA